MSEKMFAGMVGRAMSQQGSTFFIVADTVSEKAWAVWAASRADALETISIYLDWMKARLPPA